MTRAHELLRTDIDQPPPYDHGIALKKAIAYYYPDFVPDPENPGHQKPLSDDKVRERNWYIKNDVIPTNNLRVWLNQGVKGGSFDYAQQPFSEAFERVKTGYPDLWASSLKTIASCRSVALAQLTLIQSGDRMGAKAKQVSIDRKARQRDRAFSALFDALAPELLADGFDPVALITNREGLELKVKS